LSASLSRSLRRRIGDFCRQRVATVLPPRDLARFQIYVLSLIDERQLTPRCGDNPDWTMIAAETGIDVDQLKAARSALRPGLDAIDRTLKTLPRPVRRPVRRSAREATPTITPAFVSITQTELATPRTGVSRTDCARPRSLPPAAPWTAPDTFDEALSFHMRRYGDTGFTLHKGIIGKGETTDVRTLNSWRQGRTSPRSVESLALLERIELRYGLEPGYFTALLPDPSRSSTGHRMSGIGAAERRRLAWHLPDDFNIRPEGEQEEILDWVRNVVLSGNTDYRRYQAAAVKTPFGLRFPGLSTSERDRASPTRDPDMDTRRPQLLAPVELQSEMKRLVAFKTSTLTALGYQRSGVWGAETASQKIEHLSLMFGALHAQPTGPVRGAGVEVNRLSFALLVFPRVWDWYLQWRSERRGFYTSWEVEMLNVGVALTRKDTGWLRQSPDLVGRLAPIPDLVSQEEIDAAQTDWADTCERFYVFGLSRAKEVQRISRVHRDPFEPILPVLEAESPLGEYRKITEEILRLMPNARRFPRAAAETVRAYLLIRLGLHLGLRQKNLRQLLVCPRGGRPRTERNLEDLKRGELRWSERDQGWEVLVPAVAFKNAHSSFFGNKPYRLVLPNLGGLYDFIEAWIEQHRPLLLGSASDPQTFFVKSVKTTSADAAYNQTTFYEAWRLTIQRYGIFNPYTGRGAIRGLLPHGPHNVRDVLATHILKQTGSYEQASYAIQDTPDTVAAHYGRFLPQDKAALAAQILNRVWQAA
jgi:integrase